jgi:hypothetical protein
MHLANQFDGISPSYNGIRLQKADDADTDDADTPDSLLTPLLKDVGDVPPGLSVHESGYTGARAHASAANKVFGTRTFTHGPPGIGKSWSLNGTGFLLGLNRIPMICFVESSSTLTVYDADGSVASVSISAKYVNSIATNWFNLVGVPDREWERLPVFLWDPKHEDEKIACLPSAMPGPMFMATSNRNFLEDDERHFEKTGTSAVCHFHAVSPMTEAQVVTAARLLLLRTDAALVTDYTGGSIRAALNVLQNLPIYTAEMRDRLNQLSASEQLDDTVDIRSNYQKVILRVDELYNEIDSISTPLSHMAIGAIKRAHKPANIKSALDHGKLSTTSTCNNSHSPLLNPEVEPTSDVFDALLKVLELIRQQLAAHALRHTEVQPEVARLTARVDTLVDAAVNVIPLADLEARRNSWNDWSLSAMCRIFDSRHVNDALNPDVMLSLTNPGSRSSFAFDSRVSFLRPKEPYWLLGYPRLHVNSTHTTRVLQFRSTHSRYSFIMRCVESSSITLDDVVKRLQYFDHPQTAGLVWESIMAVISNSLALSWYHLNNTVPFFNVVSAFVRTSNSTTNYGSVPKEKKKKKKNAGTVGTGTTDKQSELTTVGTGTTDKQSKLTTVGTMMNNYFSPLSFVSLPKSNLPKSNPSQLDATLASIHDFIRNHPSRFVSTTFIGFQPGVACFDGCLVIRVPLDSPDSDSDSTTTSASSDSASSDSPTASVAQMKFNLILIQLTTQASKTHGKKHTDAIKLLRERESNRPADGIQLNVLGTCYAHSTPKFSVTGTCDYPVDTVYLDLPSFVKKMYQRFHDNENPIFGNSRQKELDARS